MMGLFRKMMRKRRNMRPRNMGMMAGLAGLRDRMRPARNMMFGGRRQLNPFLGMNNLPRKNRFLPPLSELPPQPGGNRKFLDMFGSGASSDIMPQDPGFGVNLPKPRPIMPGFTPIDRIGNYNLEKENFFGTPNKDPNDSSFGPGDPGYRPGPVLPPPGMVKPVPGMLNPVTSPVQPQPTGPVNPSLLKPVDYQPVKDDYSGYLSFYDNPPVPGMKDGGDADKSEFPDLSGDGKITEKDILIGRGVIEMNMGGDPADEQARSLMSEADRTFLGSVDNDADFRNAQNALMNYRNFYASQPTGFQQFLPSPDQLMENPEALMNLMKQDNARVALGEEGRMVVNDIDMMLRGLDNSEKKSLNPPMMFR